MSNVVNFRPYTGESKGKAELRGFFDIVSNDGEMKIYGCQLLIGSNGPFVSFPAKRVPQQGAKDKYYDHANVLPDYREKLVHQACRAAGITPPNEADVPDYDQGDAVSLGEKGSNESTDKVSKKESKSTRRTIL